MHLDRLKLKKMLELVMKGDLELETTAFKTLTSAYNNSVDFVVQSTMVHPSNLRPPAPPIIRITTTTTTTIETIERTSMTECVNELKNNSLFLKMRKRAEFDATEMILAKD